MRVRVRVIASAGPRGDSGGAAYIGLRVRSYGKEVAMPEIGVKFTPEPAA